MTMRNEISRALETVRRLWAAVQRLHNFGGGSLGRALRRVLAGLQGGRPASDAAQRSLKRPDGAPLGHSGQANGEGRYQELFHFAPEAYVVTDAGGTIREANRAAVELLKVSLESIEGRALLDFVCEDDRLGFQYFMAHLGGAVRAETREVQFRTPGRHTFPCEVTCAATRAAAGNLDGIRWAVRDITERKRTEESVRQSQRELEARVGERTRELADANAALNQEIAERRRVMEQLHRRNEDLAALSVRLAEADETERQRLARELHDRVGVNLSTLGLNVSLARATTANGPPDLVCNRLDEALALIEQMTLQVRDLMCDLRPPVLDDYGLAAALQWYGERFASRTGVAVNVQNGDGSLRLAPALENALFRVAQEALSNVSKHAAANQVAVVMEASNNHVRLEVSDNGVGFDPAARRSPDAEPAWGLLIMGERTRAVKGRFQVDSKPGGGTRVTVEVPRCP